MWHPDDDDDDDIDDNNWHPDFSTGDFIKYVPSHQGEDLEEFGSQWRYKCPFEGCDKNAGRAKTIGYKEFAIHSGEFRC